MNLLSILSMIPDHRDAQGREYRLEHIVLFSVLALLSNAKGYTDIERFITAHFEELKNIFKLKWRRVPHFSAIRKIIIGITPQELEKAFESAFAELMHLRFEASETTAGYFSAIESYVLTYGCPLVFYSDKDSIFVVNGPDKIDGLKGQTQFQRAMRELGIHIIHANSPQAKGRVERANNTLQDRLIKEMRLRGISDIETANRYLPEFIEQHNKRFACPALDFKDAHKPLKVGQERLKLILSQQDTRKLSKNLEFSYESMIYKVLRAGRGYSFRHAQVIVCKQTNGEVVVLKDNVPLKYEVLGKARYGKLIVESKQVNLIVDTLIKEEETFEKQGLLLANVSSFPTYPQAPQPQMGAL